jgi:hypothetical protein
MNAAQKYPRGVRYGSQGPRRGVIGHRFAAHSAHTYPELQAASVARPSRSVALHLHLRTGAGPTRKDGHRTQPASMSAYSEAPTNRPVGILGAGIRVSPAFSLEYPRGVRYGSQGPRRGVIGHRFAAHSAHPAFSLESAGYDVRRAAA